MKKKYDAICILSNRLNQKGVLAKKSKQRASLAAKIYKAQHIKPIILVLGWNYRKDCNITLAESFKNYLVKNLLIPHNKIYKDRRPRDTIGEAIFSFLKIKKLKKIKDVCIVTHKSHLKRAKFIFDFIYNGKFNVSFECVDEIVTKNTQLNENKSLNKFKKTFKCIKRGDINEVLQIIVKNHPNYNGENYKKFRLNVFKT